MRYVSKSTEVDAMQWVIDATVESGHERAQQIVSWVNANGGEAQYRPMGYPVLDDQPVIAVRTINGWAFAKPGHYVVMDTATFPTQGHDGLQPVAEHVRDFYPCDPATFEQRWEPAP